MLADVETGRQHRVDRIARESAQEASLHPMITLEVADLGLHSAASSPACTFRAGGSAASLVGHIYLDVLRVSVSAIPFVDVRIGRAQPDPCGLPYA